MKLPALILAAIAFGGTALAETLLVNIKGAEVEVYKKASGDDLRIYRLDPEGHDPKTDKRPAVVFFFGGSWNGGSVAQFEPHANYLAGRGIVAFLADYRVKSRQKTPPLACVEDGKSAIRWVRQNAERLGVDPDKIIAGGGSAGGHVAATTGICDGLEGPNEDLSISSKSEALLLFNPVYDNGPDGYGHDRITEWFPAISPAHNITKGDPPTIVFLGSEDKLIPVSTAKKFRDDQEALGIKSELHVYEGEPHGFFNLKLGQGKKEHFIDTILKTDAFLVDLGYLEDEADKALLESISETAKK
ncbi:MAG: alpha/beta hydrolase [Verrucomicrobiota bacterium]|nr:alpha/beta hydrolase [Verrucomicrobiota bacterium]